MKKIFPAAQARLALSSFIALAWAASGAAQIVPGLQTGSASISGYIDPTRYPNQPLGLVFESYSIANPASNDQTVTHTLSELGNTFSAASGSTENAVFTATSLDFSGTIFATSEGFFNTVESQASSDYTVAFDVTTPTTFDYIFQASTEGGNGAGGELTGIGKVAGVSVFSGPYDYTGQIVLDTGSYDLTFDGEAGSLSTGNFDGNITSFDIHLTAVPDESPTWESLAVGIIALVVGRRFIFPKVRGELSSTGKRRPVDRQRIPRRRPILGRVRPSAEAA